MAFYVGQKVVCVNAGVSATSGHIAVMLREGAIYTVAGYVEDWPFQRLYVEEAEPLVGTDGFDPTRFRPITERKTDISIFKAMLNPSKAEVTA